MNSCRACQAPIEWRRHIRTGKSAPIEMKAAEDGNVILIGTSQYRTLRQGEVVQVKRYHNHFANCPKAEAFKRRDPKAHREKETRAS